MVGGADDLEFKWGKKKSLGGIKKNVQFYESFTYDGDEYRLYDCVLVGDPSEPDSAEPFVAKIIKIWEQPIKTAKSPRQVKLLWFFKPSEILPYLEGVPDVLANELFLASGEGPCVASVNQLEAICGKCSVLCISKDKRNPQPADEEIKSTDFVYRRVFDVGSCKVLDTIDEKIAGVDVKFIFNRAGCKKEATVVPKVEADINGSSDSLKPNGLPSSVSAGKTEDNLIGHDEGKEKGQDQLGTEKSTFAEKRSNNDSGVQEGTTKNKHVSSEASGSRRNIGHEEGKEKGQDQLATKKSTFAEKRSNNDSGVQEGTTENKHVSSEVSGSRRNIGHEEGKQKGQDQLVTKKSTFAEKRSNNDSGVQEGMTENKHVSSEASGSRDNHCDGKAQETEVKKQFTKQKSLPAEERCNNSCKASSSRVYQSNSKEAQANDVKKQLTKQLSMPGEARNSKDLNGLDDRPRKKQKLDGSVIVPDVRNTNILQNIRPGGRKDAESFKSPGDKVTGDEAPPQKPNFVKKNQDMGVSVSEGKDARIATEKRLSKKPSFDGKLLKRAEDKMLADDCKRNYQVIEVTRKPDAVNSKWFRPLPWEESMNEAEKQGRLVLLQNLDPTYTSGEVQDIVYSALNEQCTARMIERTSATISHIGQALVIFNSREAAERAIGRLNEGCLLLSNGRPLVAGFARTNPPGKPSSFPGHIKPHKIQMRREMRDAVATSHCSQPNNLEFDMAMEWFLHQARSELAAKRVSKRQMEERKSLRINFKPKLA